MVPQPIKTAPKDKPVLIFQPFDQVGWWYGKKIGKSWYAYSELCPAEFYNREDNRPHRWHSQPTHWLPLPEHPFPIVTPDETKS